MEVENVIPIAGNFDASTGQNLNPKYTRLKSQDSNTEGVQIELHGGNYAKKRQQAVIQLECDRDRTGNERVKKRDEGDEGEEPPTASLTYVSYGDVEGKERLQVLRLNWKTKYACEDFTEDDGEKKGGWGFFTWFILMYVGSKSSLSQPAD